jgi:DNA repair exonuclease SbcCD ATPase subunit
MSATTKYIDHLNEDPVIPGQLWVCISFLSPEGIKNCNVRGLKIRGVYATREQADRRAEELRNSDPDFHVFVGEVGKWLPWDPDPNDAEEQQYLEKELNDLMKGHKDNLAKAKRLEEQRKSDMLTKAAQHDQEITRANKQKDKMRKKLEKKKQQKRVAALLDQNNNAKSNDISDAKLTKMEEDLKKKEEELKTKEQLAQQERKRLDEVQKVVSDKQQVVESIDEKLAKIQELYKKINKQ